MMRDPLRPPEKLLGEITRDLRPVKPSPLPSRLALRSAPLAALAFFAMVALIGLRRGSGVLGLAGAWGMSIAQVGMGVMLIWISARESTPARRLPQYVVWAAVAVAWLMVATITMWTFRVSPTEVPAGWPVWRVGFFCGFGGTTAGSVLVGAFASFSGRSLAARPALAGALYGAAAGVTVNAAWRLSCPISTPWHTITAHGGAVVLTTLTGAIAAHLMAKRARLSPGRA